MKAAFILKNKFSMLQLKNITREHLHQIAVNFAESFLAMKGSLSSCMGHDEAVIYFEEVLYEYQRIGALYALSENEEGYIVYHLKKNGVRWYRDLYLFLRYLAKMNPETLQRMILIRRGWTDYSIAHADTKNYVDVALVSVKKEYQGKGYLRKLMAEPFALAEKLKIPVILDTDSEYKAIRYEHIGMRVEKDALLESGLHFYTMIYVPE